MKNILVFWTASDEVMGQLFTELPRQGHQVYCFIQDGRRKIHQKKYGQVIFVDSESRDFQSEILRSTRLEGMFFEEIYVPSSSPYFRNYENVFFFIEKLNYKEKILYDCYGNKRCYKAKNRMQKKFQYIESICLFNLYSCLYRAKNIFRGRE